MRLTDSSFVIAALVGMVAVTILALRRLRRAHAITVSPVWWTIPVLALAGLIIALYLTYLSRLPLTDLCHSRLECSRYGRFTQLFGAIPRGLPGLVGYATILAAWGTSQFGKGRLASYAPRLLLVLTATGEFFSIGLTVIEPFVIGISCVWCLSSAVIMTLLFWLSAEASRGLALSASSPLLTPLE